MSTPLSVTLCDRLCNLQIIAIIATCKLCKFRHSSKPFLSQEITESQEDIEELSRKTPEESELEMSIKVPISNKCIINVLAC